MTEVQDSEIGSLALDGLSGNVRLLREIPQYVLSCGKWKIRPVSSLVKE